MLPIDTITGRSFLIRSISCQITSEASALPPGLFTLSTTAFTASSRRTSRSRAASELPPTSPSLALPSTI